MNSTSRHDDPFCYTFYFVLDVLCAGIICLFGSVSNIINLVIFFGSSVLAVNPLVLLLRGLAVTDLVYLALYGLNQVWPALDFYTGYEHTRLAVLYCWAYVWPVVVIALSLTTWYTVLISVHRYVAVMDPIRVLTYSTRRKVKAHMLIVSVVAVVLNVPIFFEVQIVDTIDPATNESYKDYAYTDMYNNHYYQLIYKNIIMLVYRRYAPMAIISFVGVRIIRRVREAGHARARLTETEGGGAPRMEGRVTRTMLSIMITFVVCQLPGIVYPVARLIVEVDYGYCSLYSYYSQVAGTMELLNSAVNILIYLSTSQSYRREMKKCCTCCCSHDDSVQSSVSRSSHRQYHSTSTLYCTHL